MTSLAPSAYGTIVICGGGCYGGYYARQLARARAAGVVNFDAVVVVDRDPDCRVARLVEAIAQGDDDGMRQHGWTMHGTAGSNALDGHAGVYRGMPIHFACEDWEPFFRQWFGEAVVHGAKHRRDAVVPSPLMPNLLADWVTSRLLRHRPDAPVRRLPLSAPPATPWARTGADDSHYASFATWMCPINCIEPARCPETRGPRNWSMPVAVELAARDAATRDEPFDVIALFTTTHRVFGVGMFDASDAVAADAAIAAVAGADRVRVLVASVSHCHGALAELESRP